MQLLENRLLNVEGDKMMPKRPIATVLGLLLILVWFFFLTRNKQPLCLIPCIVGASLLYIGYRPGRVSTIVFGHVCVVVGCYLVTWGVYLLPYCEPTLAHIFGRPLFWGLFSIFGGICALYHGFCRCFSVNRSDDE